MNDAKKTVAFVDDDSINLNIGKTILEEKYNVVSIPSAEELFATLDKVNPALILLDIEMPKMNGLQAIEILKSKPETRDIPVVFLTCRTEDADKSTGLALGAVDYIFKPYNPEQLLKKIELVLGE